jgi:hypothetical protein
MTKPVTERVMALVLKKLGHAEFHPVSDLALARCLGTNGVQAGRIRKGEYPMSRAIFVRAMTFLEFDRDQYIEFSLDFDREVTADDDRAEEIFVRLRAIREGEAVAKLTGQGISPRARRRGASAGILLAGFLGMAGVHDARASVNPVVSQHSPASCTSEQCILC